MVIIWTDKGEIRTDLPFLDLEAMCRETEEEEDRLEREERKRKNSN